MSARDKLIELAEAVIQGRVAVPEWAYRMANAAIDEVQREQEGPHAPLRCVLCGSEVGVMETATHKCLDDIIDSKRKFTTVRCRHCGEDVSLSARDDHRCIPEGGT